MLAQAGIPRLMRAFNKIEGRRTRVEMVKLVEKIAGVKPVPRKRGEKPI
jgi:hypothetical protein